MKIGRGLRTRQARIAADADRQLRPALARYRWGAFGPLGEPDDGSSKTIDTLAAALAALDELVVGFSEDATE